MLISRTPAAQDAGAVRLRDTPMSRLQLRWGILLAALALSACGDHDRDRHGDRDRGPETSEQRELAAFDAIEMSGAARLEIAVGQPLSVVVEGRQSMVERVKTEVRDHTLYIEAKPNGWIISRGKPRITINVSLPQLAALKLEGGNDVVMSGFTGGAANINVAGATRLKAEGQLEQLTVHMAGAGHADLSRLIADHAKVTVDGVGSIVVHSKDTLDATMNGVGAILYTGSPRQVSTRMNGLGTIGQQRAEDEGRGHDDDRDEHEQARPPVNPDDLPLEREDPATQKPASDTTEVI
jgi:Putative auto-transporter adhesin, head GIN domain